MTAHTGHTGLHFLVDDLGVGLDPNRRCGHEDTGVSLDLIGTPCRPGLPRQFEVKMARCFLASAVGALLARIRHDEGDEAAQRFRDQVLLVESAALHDLNGGHL